MFKKSVARKPEGPPKDGGLPFESFARWNGEPDLRRHNDSYLAFA